MSNLENAAHAIVDAEGFTVCSPSPMGQANARLVAAAPELLAAVVIAFQAIDRFLPDELQWDFAHAKRALAAALDRAGA